MKRIMKDFLVLYGGFIVCHAVTNSNFCKNVDGFCWVFFKLSADIRHIYTQNFIIGFGVGTPYTVHYRRVGHYLAGILGEERNNLILDGRQVYGLSINCDHALKKINFQTLCPIEMRDGIAVVCGRVAVSQGGADSCHQFRNTEGFGQVVVCASIKGAYFVDFQCAGGNFDNFTIVAGSEELY